MKEYPSNEEVGKRFDEKFEGYWRGRAIPDEIKFFLSSTRLSDLEAIEEWVNKTDDFAGNPDKWCSKENVLSYLNSLKENV